MAWPKRGTRRIVVDGEDFVWHYAAHCPWCSDDVMTAGREGAPHVLFIDPFATEITPRAVAAAIRWARANGWTPEQGPAMAVSQAGGPEDFDRLEDGQRHAACAPPPNDDV